MDLRDRLEEQCTGNLENVWNGRPISKLLLRAPVTVGDGLGVDLIELIPPFHQRVYRMGLEHVGLVVGDHVDALIERRPQRSCPSLRLSITAPRVGHVTPADPSRDDDLLDRLRADLRAALKARDRGTAAALRSVLAEVDNAGAVAAPDGPAEQSSPHVAGAVAGLGRAEATRRHLDGSAVASVVRAEVDGRREAADAYDAAGQGERAAALRAEADRLASYL